MLRWSLWFLLINSVLLMLVAFNFLKSMSLPDTVPAKIFLAIAYPGHCISLSLYLFPLIALAILAFPARKFVFTVSTVLQTILLLLIIIDSLVFAQYRFHLNGMIWNLLTGGAAKDILPVTTTLWVLLAASIALVAAVEWTIATLCLRWVSGRSHRYGAVTATVTVLVILAGHGMHAWADANHYTQITKQVRYLPAYKPLTAKKLLVKLGLASKETDQNTLKAGSGSALNYPLETIRCSGSQSGGAMNLLLIVIDSWRFDAMSPQITPNIWQVSQNGLKFDNHYSSGNGTRFGIFGLFYGIYGTYWHSILAEEKSPVLMRELVRQNYRMAIYGSAPLINPEFDRTVFADIRNSIELRQTGGGSVENDLTITDKMVTFIASHKKSEPFFGFLFFDAPHVAGHPDSVTPFKPFLKEVNHLTLNNDTDPVPYFNKYKNAVYYNDILIGRVLEQLKKSGLYDNTAVLITGDHGEEFNDLKMNYWGHVGNFSHFQTQTPLVIHWPGKSAATYTHTTSHLDIAPTLMKDLLNCRTDPSKFSNGRNLLDSSTRSYVLISSWDTFSTNEPDRISVVQKSGEIDILDSAYKPLAGAKMRPEISKSAMEGMGRFYAR